MQISFAMLLSSQGWVDCNAVFFAQNPSQDAEYSQWCRRCPGESDKTFCQKPV